MADLDKPYATARTAAGLLGTTIERVVEDIEAGMAGRIGTLTGGAVAGLYVVHSFELEGEQLQRHRARLADQPGLVRADQPPVVTP